MTVTAARHQANLTPAAARWLAVAARAATSWLVALALLLEVALSAFAPVTANGPLELLAAQEICHSLDASAPADSKDRVVVHFKCIGCVLACSLPPPALNVTLMPVRILARVAQGWPLSAAAPRGPPSLAHFARGPPILA
ncbi:hypothetical protein [Rhodopseudomonas sp. B29]|uniref:hypothetical protein n=1 Tax=Rhodopseudomonas sp. B29 TaxID=95607 RepID=UPI00034AFC46|nr:hypothetical protein [Rhodopseudomonas sp. B29]